MPARIALAAAAVAAAVVLFLVLRPDGEEASTPAPTTSGTLSEPNETVSPTTTEAPKTTEAVPRAVRVRIVFTNGNVSGPRRVEVELGRRVVVVVGADVSDHVHVHGYDLMRDVGPGQPARIAFKATDQGRFEVELEDRHLRLTELVVSR
jgi:hypothetical protein